MCVAASLAVVTALPAAAKVETAAPATKQRFDIPAQKTGDALNAFSRQSGLRLLFSYDAVQGKKTDALRGEFTTDEALKRLLAGTGLCYQMTADSVVLIRESNESTSGSMPADQMQVAIADGAVQQHNAAAQEKEGAQVVVEGRREQSRPFSAANLDLTRTEDDVLPFTVFTAQEISQSGAVNLTDFLQNRLPQNFNSTLSYESTPGGVVNPIGRIDSVSLRGWDASETVILLNGRRLPAQYQSNNTDARGGTPSLQGIPLGSIERIEILTSAGSAIYGANATGGVINIITRLDYHGGQFDLNYQTPANVYRPTRGLNMSYGLPLRHEIGLRLSASLNESEPLQVGDRADVTVERWRQRVLQVNPARLMGASLIPPPFGATPNIRANSLSASATLFGPGTPAFTTVPDGYTGGRDLSV
jgi:iron complex outermembrane receptor protein